MEKIKFSIKSILEVLETEQLTIPDYQRPYKWERRNIRNLFYDVREAIEQNIGEYRIGSLILHHRDDVNTDVVDGQQRLISISLLLFKIYNGKQYSDLKVNIFKNRLPMGSNNLLNINYNDTSQQYAKENYDEWCFLINLISIDEISVFIDYLLNNCKVTVIELPKECLQEAFQLFDSQNNRGLSLEPHDLLKAYHLRTIKNPTELVVRRWEQLVSDDQLKLKDLFDKHLFRIRRWSIGDPGLYKKKFGSELRFSNRFIDDFKGVTLFENDYPYLKLYKDLKDSGVKFPNSLCMPILNGESFFELIEYAHDLIKTNYYSEADSVIINNGVHPKLEELIMTGEKKFSRNQNLFMNLLILAIDRFGKSCVNKEMIELIFIWSFYPRAVAKALYDSTIANYAAGGTFHRKKCQKVFQVLSISSTPRDFISKIDTDLLDNHTTSTLLEQILGDRYGKPTNN